MRILFLFSLFSLSINLFSQTFSREYGDFTIKIESENNYKIISFSKNKESDNFNYLKFEIYNTGIDSIYLLTNQLPLIEKYWKIANDSISIILKGMTVGYPLEYKDLLIEHINIFINNKEWQNYYIEYKKSDEYVQLNYDLIENIMIEHNSYDIVSPLLLKFKYSLSGISIEKVGFITDSDIQKYKLLEKYPKEKLKTIPIPFIVFLNLEKL